MRPLLALAVCLLLALDDVEPAYQGPVEVTPPQVHRMVPCSTDQDCCEQNPLTCREVDPELYALTFGE